MITQSVRQGLSAGIFSLFIAIVGPLSAKPPESVIERRMDPSLRLLYRAAKGKSRLDLGRAGEVHSRIHKSRPNRRTVPRLELLARYAGPQSDLEAAGFAVQAKVGEIYTGTVATDRLGAIAELPGVRLLQSSTTFRAAVSRCAQGAPRQSPTTRGKVMTARVAQPLDLGGTGVIVAFIDTGADVFHDDFRKSDGTTRIKYLLDFSNPGDTDGDGDLDGAGPYGGTLYTESQINAAIVAGSFGQKDTTGHGTHGLSIAAGDDAALPGIAPTADLIVVKATREDGTLAFTSADIINALAFVNAKATELGQPYVANLSLGTLFSSHDGRSLEEQAIDALVGPGVLGKVIVVAAGNSSENRGTLKRHYRGTTYVGIPVNQSLVVPSYSPNAGKGNDRIVVDVWYEGNDKATIKVTSPNGHVVTAPYGDYADLQTPDGDVFIANLGGANPENGDVEAIILIDDWAGSAPQAGNWTLSVEATEIGATGEFHAWVTDDSVVGNASPTLGGGADNRLLIGKPGGAYNAVTVGSYARHLPGTRFLTNWTDVNGIARTDASAIDGDISEFSSPGRTRDGRVKPEVAAPGERVRGAVSRDAMPGVSPTSIFIYHPFAQVNALLTDQSTNHAFGMLQGTSFSAPVVTGLAARILSTNRLLDAIQVRNIVINTAVTDSFTGAVPNELWGYGKVDQSIGSAPLPNDLRIIPDALPSGVRNEQYNLVMTASGGTLPYTWSVIGGSLPPGLTLETRGFLSGMPTTPGSYAITIQVTDSSGTPKTASKPLTIVIASVANLHITSVAQPIGHLDKAYESQFTAVGGTLPYAWTLAGGSLPTGLTLSTDGSITGTPAQQGSYPFTVRVLDAASAMDLRSQVINVKTGKGDDWSVLGKSAPTVTELVVDPSDPNRVIAATTGMDAVFESRSAGDSWQPISINNGLNTSALNLRVNPVSSKVWGIARSSVNDYRAFYYDGGIWTAMQPYGDPAVMDALDVAPSGIVYAADSGNGSFLSSTDGTPWQFRGNYYPQFAHSLCVAPAFSTMYLTARGAESRRTLVSLNGGVSWSDVTNGSSGLEDITVSASDSNDILKVGDLAADSLVERSVDGGRNWTSVVLGGGFPQMRRSPTDSSLVILGTQGGFYKSTNGGSSFTRLSIGGTNAAVTAVAIDPSDASTLYAATSDGVKRTRDGGLTWNSVSNGLVRRVLADVRVSPSTADVAVASIEGPYLSRTSGDTWTRSTPGMTSFATRRMAISGADPNLYFAGTEGEIYRSANRGVTWTRVDAGVATGYVTTAIDADPTDARYVLFSLSGTRGTYRSTDGGLTFASANAGLPFGTPNDLSFARDMAHAGRVYIALTSDGIYRSENRGATWSAFGLNTQTTRAVEPAPSDSDYVYAAGATQVYFFDPAVGSWQPATTGPANPILCIAVDPTNKLTAFAGADHPGTPGNTGGVYKTTNGGRNWTRLPGLLDQLDVVALAAHPSASGLVWAATANGGVFRTDDGGATWKELGNYGTIADLTNVNVQDPSNAFLLFAGTEGYGVQASTDGGRTFVPRVTGLGNLYVNAVAFDPDTPTTIYAGTDSGVYKSTDSGNNWSATALPSGEITDLVTVNDGTGKLIWATVNGVGVAYSANGGSTFTTYNSGLASLQLTSIEVENRGSGKRIWATTHGGDGVAFSDDLGATWTSGAGNGLTDRDINDIAIQGGTGKLIWATGDRGVFTSTDDGLSWREISIGLPSGVPVTSISIDPNSGETLVSLFSENGGGIYRGGSVNGVWREFSTGLSERQVKKLTRGSSFSVDPSTLGARFYAATAGDGVYSTLLQTPVGNAPVVTTTQLPEAVSRENYATTLSASGGTPPYAWSVTKGSLPPGLTLLAGTGAITGSPGTSGFFTFTVQAADRNQRTGSRELTIKVTSPLIASPAGVVASATAPNNVSITWEGVGGAASYQVYRSTSTTNYVLMGSTPTTSYSDGTAAPASAYLYAIKAVDAANNKSSYSRPDLATTLFFTDSTLIPGLTAVKAAHITELRAAVNAVRALAGLAATSFTDPVLSSSISVKSAHLTELRSALDAARSTLHLMPLTYTDANVAPGATIIKAAHVLGLRSGVQ